MKFSQLFVLLIIALQFLVAQGLIYDAGAEYLVFVLGNYVIKKRYLDVIDK
uniref:Uncharacterized protein n=1 Tax=Meloidogyne enterolobii TaxID=390850 RepID=A0A6V7UIV7_MELEN|nr:unnamed protein product [Meloidogyne enterolobii]